MPFRLVELVIEVHALRFRQLLPREVVVMGGIGNHAVQIEDNCLEAAHAKLLDCLGCDSVSETVSPP
jgi:hypothetical protein